MSVISTKPRCATVVCALLAAWTATTYRVHTNVKASCRNVSFNDAQMHQQGLTIAVIEALTPVPDCAALEEQLSSTRKSMFSFEQLHARVWSMLLKITRLPCMLMVSGTDIEPGVPDSCPAGTDLRGLTVTGALPIGCRCL